MKTRPARTCRNITSQAWSRYSLRKPKKNYVRALPHTSLLVFKMGVDKPDYDVQMHLSAKDDIQLRSNSLEAARQVANKYLERELPNGYYFRVLTYPHNVIREKKRATGAGADRISQGMAMSFGRAISMAARVYKGQNVFEIKIDNQHKNIAKEAFKRAASKLSGTFTVNVKELKAENKVVA